jgi:hypothetical protein
MIWVYAVCDRPELGLPDVRALCEAPLEGVTDGPLLAVASSHERVPDGPALHALRAHERVVEALMEQHTVVPMRYGTSLPGISFLQSAIAARRERLLDALDRVRGRVEIAVRAVHPGPAPGAATGREFLEGKRAVAALYDSLAGLAVASRRWPERTPAELLRASYLIDSPEVEHFRGSVEQLQHEHPETALLCTGPWPAYSFVEGGGR